MILGMSIFFSGCRDKVQDVPNPNSTIEHVQGDLKQDVKTLEGTTGTIKDNASQGKNKTPDPVKPVLDPYWTQILIQAGVQEKVIEDLKSKDGELQKAIEQGTKLKEFASSETSRANKAEKERDDALNNKLIALIVLGVVCLALSFVISNSGYPFGKGLGIGSGVLIVASLATMKLNQVHIPESAVYVFMGILALVCAGFGVWYYYTHRKDKTKLSTENGELKAETERLEAENEEINHMLDQAQAKYVEAAKKLTLATKQKRKDFLTKMRQPVAMPKAEPVVDTKVNAIEDRIKVVEGRTNELAKRQAVVETKVQEQGKKIDAIEQRAVTAEKSADQARFFVEGMAAGMNGTRKIDPWTARVA
jgi:outer membrane murein-binding lipoprotein Lpp